MRTRKQWLALACWAIVTAGVVAAGIVFIPKWQRAREERRQQVEEWTALGLKENEGDNHLAMIEEAEQILRGEGDPRQGREWGYIMRAYARARLGKYEEALDDYRQARLQLPAKYGKAPMMHDLVLTLAARGRYDDAIMLFEQLLADFPDRYSYPYGRFLYSTKEDKRRDTARAVTLLRKSIEQSKKATASDYQTLAEALASDGKFEEAIINVDVAVDLGKRHWKEREEWYLREIVRFKEIEETKPLWTPTRERKEKDLASALGLHERWLEHMKTCRELYEKKEAPPRSKRF